MYEVYGTHPARTEDNRDWLSMTDGARTKELVTPSKRIFVAPLMRRILVIPAGTCAVLTFRNGRRKVYTEGMHTIDGGALWGWCLVRYVDTMQHRTPIPLIQALCKDGWRAGLASEIFWRVCDAVHIVDIADPIGDLVMAAKAATRAVIESTSHDALIGGSNNGAASAADLAQSVVSELKQNAAIRGIEILRVLVTDRQGDERRIEIVQDATVNRTRIANDTALVSQQMDLERTRQDLVLLEAETRRKRIEEESKVRIREAEIEAEVMQRSLHAKWQNVQLELAAETNQQQHEETLKVIEAYGKVLSKAAKLWQLQELGIYSRRGPELRAEGLEDTLSEGLCSLKNVLQQPRLNPIIEQMPERDGRTATWMRIVAEVAEISQLAEVQGCHLEMGKQNGEDRLIIQLGDRRLNICCQPGYPNVPPEVRWADNGQRPVPLNWSKNMTLKDILEKIQVATNGHK